MNPIFGRGELAWMTVSEAARLARVPKGRIYRLAKRGILRPVGEKRLMFDAGQNRKWRRGLRQSGGVLLHGVACAEGDRPGSIGNLDIEVLERPDTLFPMHPDGVLAPLSGVKLGVAKRLIERNHYTHSLPSGKSHYFHWRGALVVFSIPANQNLGRFILKRPCVCWELSRLWACDAHAENALTEAISYAAGGFRRVERKAELLVSFADPDFGHEGFVYRAASWVYTGVSEESRKYQDSSGRFFSRRKFHAGAVGMTKAEIEEAGYRQVLGTGKKRFAKGLNRKARSELVKLYQSDNTARRCFECGREIRECMGIVLARDVLAIMRGERLATMRERCGVCAVRRELVADGKE